MAYLTATPHAHSDARGGIGRVVSGIGSFMISLGAAHRWQREIEQLQSQSDAALAERGIKREDIVRHVIGTSYYI